MPKIAGWFITFIAVNVAWVFFRAEDFQTAFAVLKAMLGMTEGSALTHIFTGKWMAIIAALVCACALLPGVREIETVRFRMNKKWLAALLGLFLYTLSQCSHAGEFLYFQF